MLSSKSSCLRKSIEFDAVKKRGIRVRAGSLQVAFLKREGGVPRLGLVLSKKVGGAVCRNRIRRVIREFFRLNRGSFPAGDIVVIPTSDAGDKENFKIREFLEAALLKLPKNK